MQAVLTEIISAITGSFTTLGKAVLELIKHGFIWLFTEYTENSGTYTITGLSPFAYFVFILMGQLGSTFKELKVANPSNSWNILRVMES